MEIIREFIVRLILFGLIEAWMFNMFIKKHTFNYNYAFKDVLCVGFIAQLADIIVVPIMKQIVMVMSFATYLSNKDISVKSSVVYSIKFMLMLLVLETSVFMFYDIFMDLILVNLSVVELFLMMIPMRVIEVIIIKFWIGGVEKWVQCGMEKSKKQKK